MEYNGFKQVFGDDPQIKFDEFYSIYANCNVDFSREGLNVSDLSQVQNMFYSLIPENRFFYRGLEKCSNKEEFDWISEIRVLENDSTFTVSEDVLNKKAKILMQGSVISGIDTLMKEFGISPEFSSDTVIAAYDFLSFDSMNSASLGMGGSVGNLIGAEDRLYEMSLLKGITGISPQQEHLDKVNLALESFPRISERYSNFLM